MTFTSMNYRSLGRSELALSEIGYGAWGLGGMQWTDGSDSESVKALHRAFELGINLIDTALAYGDGHSERLVGRAFREWGRPIFVATKIPPKNRVWPAAHDAVLHDVFPRQYIINCTETSLRNLGVETIDLQQLHVWNGTWTEQDEWRDAFELLKRSGKVRFAGVSLTEHDPDAGLDLARTGSVDALQVLYHIFDPSAAEKLFPAAQQAGIGILARVPLDEGALTGKIREDTFFNPDDFRATYFRGDRKRQVAERVGRLQQLLGEAADLPKTAIRFCLSHPAVTSVVPGMRRVSHVEANVGAAAAGALPPRILSMLAEHKWSRNFYN